MSVDSKPSDEPFSSKYKTEIATPLGIKGILLNPVKTEFRRTGGSKIDESHPLGGWSTLTSKDNPAIIYDDGAAFCSPVIVFDNDGTALHFHDSLIANENYGMFAQKYFYAIPNYLNIEKGLTACIAGANIPLNEELVEKPVNPIDELINFVEDQIKKRVPKSQFEVFISKQYKNQRKNSQLIDNNTTVRGLVFVPKYLANDDANHLFAILDNEVKNMRLTFHIGHY